MRQGSLAARQSRVPFLWGATALAVSLLVASSAFAAPPSTKPSHPLDTRGQGNMGQPDMLDPYGLAKDDRKELTGNRGRVIREVEPVPEPDPTPVPEPDPVPVPEPDPTPVPDPEPTPTPDPAPVFPPDAVVDLAAPFNGVTAWAWRYSGTGAALTLYMEKSLQWSWTSDTRLVGFQVYEERPGEAAFTHTLTVDLSMGAGWHTVFSDPTTGEDLRIFISDVATGGTQNAIAVFNKRVSSSWPAGAFRHYVIPVDAQRQPGHASAELVCVNLGELPMLRPTDGQVLSSPAAFQWSDILQSVRTSASTGFYEVVVWDETVAQPVWRKLLPLDATGVVYDGVALTPGRTYYLVTTVRVWDQTTTNAISQSKRLTFSVQ